MERKQGIKSRANAHRQEMSDPSILLERQYPSYNKKKPGEIDLLLNHEPTNIYNDNQQYYNQGMQDNLEGLYENQNDDKFRKPLNRRNGINRSVNKFSRGNNKTTRRPKKRKSYHKTVSAVIVFLMLMGILGTTTYLNMYGLSKEEMDVTEYYGTLETDEMVIVLNNTILTERAIIKDGMQYLPYNLVNDSINPKIYWDYKENLLLYSYAQETKEYQLNDTALPNGFSSPIALKNEDTLYVSMEYIKQHTDLDQMTYNYPERIVISTEWEGQQLVIANKNTQVRYRGGVKSEILTQINKGEELVLLEEGQEWSQVGTKNGFIGYIQNKRISQPQTNQRVSDFEKEVYPNISLDKPIVMGWHQTTNQDSNANVDRIIEGTTGLTIIAPTWFFINDTGGNITSLASQSYVDYVHNKGIDVWATLNDFDGAIGTQSDTYEVLSSTSKRKKIISSVISEIKKYNIDGINVDIELVGKDTGNHFIQFIRELSIECRKNGVVLSVDNYPPKVYNAHFEYAEQGEVVDYVVIMGYDEYHGGSKESGPVSSITYVEDAIKEMSTMVEEEKIINAVPFYSRIWAEVTKTEYELTQDIGTDDEGYLNSVSTVTYTMDAAYARIEESGATLVWDDTTKHNYATWEESPKTYKMWIEDEDSIREKLSIMKNYNLAGVAIWKLGIEQPQVWDEITNYITN